MFQEGDVLCSKYKLKKRFNKGGFSSVWLATDLKAQVDFALKIYDSVEDMDEFRKGFNLVVNLNHSNIFKPLSYDVFEGTPFLVLPYCQKGSAVSLVGHATEDEIWNFIHDVASGLAYLHDYKSIVHQDIKPGNVLIDDDGKFMITDFDISTRQRHTVKMTERQVLEMQDFNYGSGTPEYMGPERWPDDGYVPPVKPMQASDIWSLGATLFELMSGQVPFGDTGGAYQRKFNAIPEMPDNYSKELKKLVKECLSPYSWERPTAQQLAEASIHHKAPLRHKHTRSFIILLACLVPIISISLIVVVNKVINKIDKRRTEMSELKKNDSILLARISEANLIVYEYSKSPSKYDNYASEYVNMLIKAALLYQSTDTLKVSSEIIRERGKMMWNNSIAIFNDEYNEFTRQEDYFREMDATAAADSFAQRKIDISKFVSNKVINN